MTETLEIARQVVRDEAHALSLLVERLDDAFAASVQTILASDAPLIVSGLGKSGAIGKKIAASLTSTGTPAVFMHPVEALHGDLGIVNERNCLIALSRSGDTAEILTFVQHFRRLGGPVIGITQGVESRLAELSTHALLLPDVAEAGPLQLAPTTSCLTTLAMGDALTMALLHARGFAVEDFARFHPDGALGRRLLLRAGDLMHAGDELPLVSADVGFDELIVAMTEKRLGLAILTEADGALLGVFTDGDLRRVFQRVPNTHAVSAREAFQKSRRDAAAPPVLASSVTSDRLAIDCLAIMRQSQITSLIVVDDSGRPRGILRLMDLLAAGLR